MSQHIPSRHIARRGTSDFLTRRDFARVKGMVQTSSSPGGCKLLVTQLGPTETVGPDQLEPM